MRTLVRGAASLAFVMFVVSCSGLLKKKDGDAGADASTVVDGVDAAAVPGAAPLATNEGDIARFPDEVKLADVRAIVQHSFNVREAPPAGVLIVGLAKGTAVTQIAQREKSVLIVFDNAKAPGTKLMGWISRDAFIAVVQDAGPLQCAKGEISIFGDTPMCGKLCSADTDCPAGQACKGTANKVLPNGKVGDGVTVCTVFHAHDAGAPTPPAPPPVIDAGKAPPPVVDAGKAPPPPVVDAGKAPPPPAPVGADVVAPAAGKCPDNFLLVTKTGKCHRSCAAGITACGTKSFCVRCDKETKKVCAEDRDQCK